MSVIQLEQLKREAVGAQAGCEDLRKALDECRERHRTLKEEEAAAAEKFEWSKVEQTRAGQDFQLAELKRVTREVEAEEKVLEEILAETLRAQELWDEAATALSKVRREQESPDLGEPLLETKSSLEVLKSDDARQARMERERKLLAVRQKTDEKRTRELQATSTSLEVSKPGTMLADRIAKVTFQELRNETEREEQANLKAARKKQRDLQELQDNMLKNTKYLAAQARIRENHRNREMAETEEFEKHVEERGFSVTHEKLMKERSNRQELQDMAFATQREEKKSKLLGRLQQESELLRQRADVVSKPHWHDRLKIQTSTYPQSSSKWHFQGDVSKETETSGGVMSTSVGSLDEMHTEEDMLWLDLMDEQIIDLRTRPVDDELCQLIDEPSADGQREGPDGGALSTHRKLSGDQQPESVESNSVAKTPDMPPSFSMAMMKKEKPSQYETHQVARMEQVFKILEQPVFEEQVAAGRHYKGSGFSWKPSVILFKDFDVGATYTQNVLLTNISYTHNVCRLIGVSATVADFVSVKFTPINHISAGMTCSATIKFCPKLNKDLTGEVNFISETGRFGLPVHCRRKRRQVACAVKTLDFGNLVLAESKTKAVTLRNTGALDASFRIEAIEPIDVDTVGLADGLQSDIADAATAAGRTDTPTGSEAAFHTESQPALSGDMKVVSATKLDNVITVDEALQAGTIKGFKKRDVLFRFRPVASGDYEATFRVVLTDADVDEIILSVRGRASDLPMCVNRNTLDLKICTINFLYQDDLILSNCGNVSCSFTIDVPKAMKDHLDILPLKGVVQAKSTFAVWVKFKPKESILAAPEPFFNVQTRRLSVPVVVKINQLNQTITVNVEAVISSSDLSFNGCDVIDFDRCSVYTRTVYPVPITNNSLIVQAYGFVDLPTYIQVQPGNGFGELLPGETRMLDVVYSPTEPGEQKFSLTCKTLQDRTFTLQCRAVAHLPPLKLSHSVVEFKPTSLGNTSSAYLTVSNPVIPRSSSTVISGLAPKKGMRHFTFVVPDNVPIEVTPATGKIKPNEDVRVWLTFAPRLSRGSIVAEALAVVNEEIEKHNKALGSTNSLSSLSTSSRHLAVSSGQKSKASMSKLRSSRNKDCSPVPKAKREQLKTADDIVGGSCEFEIGRQSLLRRFDSTPAEATVECFVSGVAQTEGGTNTESKPALSLLDTLYLDVSMLTLRPPFLISAPGKARVLDFGTVAVGAVAVKNIDVANLLETSCSIHVSPLDPSGPFSLTRPCQPIGPAARESLPVRFAPACDGEFVDFIVVSEGNSRCQMKITGVAVAATYILTPSDSLDFGDTLIGEKPIKTVQVKNTTKVAVSLTADLTDIGCSQSTTFGLPVFRCLSVKSELEPGETTDISVEMNATQPALQLTCTLPVRVSGIESRLKVCGNVWATPFFLADKLLHYSQETDAPGGNGLPPSIAMRLDFTHGRRDSAAEAGNKNRIDIQTVKLPAGRKASGEFFFAGASPECLSALVNFDPAKGTSEKSVSVKMTVPQDKLLQDLVEMMVPLVFKSDSGAQQTVKIVLCSKRTE